MLWHRSDLLEYQQLRSTDSWKVQQNIQYSTSLFWRRIVLHPSYGRQAVFPDPKILKDSRNHAFQASQSHSITLSTAQGLNIPSHHATKISKASLKCRLTTSIPCTISQPKDKTSKINIRLRPQSPLLVSNRSQNPRLTSSTSCLITQPQCLHSNLDLGSSLRL